MQNITETDETKLDFQRLAYTQDEVCRAAGFKKTSCWRLEKQGILERIPFVRKPMYTVKSVNALFSGALKENKVQKKKSA